MENLNECGVLSQCTFYLENNHLISGLLALNLKLAALISRKKHEKIKLKRKKHLNKYFYREEKKINFNLLFHNLLYSIKALSK